MHFWKKSVFYSRKYWKKLRGRFVENKLEKKLHRTKKTPVLKNIIRKLRAGLQRKLNFKLKNYHFEKSHEKL